MHRPSSTRLGALGIALAITTGAVFAYGNAFEYLGDAFKRRRRFVKSNEHRANWNEPHYGLRQLHRAQCHGFYNDRYAEREAIYDRLHKLFYPDGVALWLDLPRENLGGRTPRFYMRQSRFAEVLALLPKAEEATT